MTVPSGTAWQTPMPYHEPGRARTFSAVFASVGTRVALLAIGWLVLNRTNSAVDTAIAVAGLAFPYAVMRLFAGGWITGIGPRRVAAFTDLASTVTFVGIAALYQHRTLLLIALAAVAGVLRGLADESRALVEASEDDTDERANRGIHPLVLAAGGVACGAVVAWLGVVSVVWLAALSFALCAAIAVWQSPRLMAPIPVSTSTPPGEPSREALVGDLVTQEIRIYRPVRGRGVSLNGALTGAFVDFAAQAGALSLVLLWVRYVLHAPNALSLVGGAFVVGTFAGCAGVTMRDRAIVGYIAVAAGFAAGSIPGVLALQLPGMAWPIALISFIAGSAVPSGLITRDIRVDYTGTPQERVVNDNVSAAMAYVAIPVGIALGAGIVLRLGSIAGLLAGGTLYLLAVGIPMVSRPPASADAGTDNRLVTTPVRYAGVATWIAVTLTYADGEWMVDVARKNGAGDPHAVKPTDALRAVEILDVPGVREEIELAIAADQTRAELEAQRLRDELGDLGVKLSAINEMVELSELWKSTP